LLDVFKWPVIHFDVTSDSLNFVGMQLFFSGGEIFMVDEFLELEFPDVVVVLVKYFFVQNILDDVFESENADADSDPRVPVVSGV